MKYRSAEPEGMGQKGLGRKALGRKALGRKALGSAGDCAMEERKKRIAVITTNMDTEYASEIQSGIIREAKERGFDICLFNAYVSSDETVKHNMGEYNIYWLAKLSLFSGMIVFSNLIQGRAIYDTVEKRLEKADIPIVGIDAPIGNHSWVGVDNYRPMKEIVEHFIVDHGFTRIDYISGQSFNSDSRMRLDAYRDALREHGIPVEEKRIFPGTFTRQHGRDAALEILSSGEELPEAVVCANDDIALGLCGVLREHGIGVPEQVAVSGFDNMFEARNSAPRLTTVDRELENLGREAVRRIAEYLAGEQPAKAETFPAAPIFAGSCGCVYPEENIECVREKYLNMVVHYEKHLSESNLMIEDLNDSHSFPDFLRRLKHYVKRLECDRFYLCLAQDLTQGLVRTEGREGPDAEERPVTESYPEWMSVPLAYEFGDYAEYGDFPSAQLFPFDQEDPSGHHTWLFLPVHFRNFCRGYVIVENSSFAMESQLFRSWMINLSNGLENLRRQMDLKRTVAKLDRLYMTDPLTGLYNRFGFDRFTQDSFEACRRDGRPAMLFFADLNGLKRINDNYGHDSGDAALLAVANVLRDICVRGEICARFGGDEYVVFGVNYDEEGVRRFCGEFERELAEQNGQEQLPFHVGASFGYELLTPREGDTLADWIDRADQKMYRQKKTGYGRREDCRGE